GDGAVALARRLRSRFAAARHRVYGAVSNRRSLGADAAARAADVSRHRAALGGAANSRPGSALERPRLPARLLGHGMLGLTALLWRKALRSAACGASTRVELAPPWTPQLQLWIMMSPVCGGTTPWQTTPR